MSQSVEDAEIKTNLLKKNSVLLEVRAGLRGLLGGSLQHWRSPHPRGTVGWGKLIVPVPCLGEAALTAAPGTGWGPELAKSGGTGYPQALPGGDRGQPGSPRLPWDTGR